MSSRSNKSRKFNPPGMKMDIPSVISQVKKINEQSLSYNTLLKHFNTLFECLNLKKIRKTDISTIEANLVLYYALLRVDHPHEIDWVLIQKYWILHESGIPVISFLDFVGIQGICVLIRENAEFHLFEKKHWNPKDEEFMLVVRTIEAHIFKSATAFFSLAIISSNSNLLKLPFNDDDGSFNFHTLLKHGVLPESTSIHNALIEFSKYFTFDNLKDQTYIELLAKKAIH